MARRLHDRMYPWAGHSRWARFRNLPAGVTLVSAEVWLDQRTSSSPEAWTDITDEVDASTPAFAPAIESFTIAGITYTDAAVRWTVPRDATEPPTPGTGTYRWRIRAVGSDGEDYPAVIQLDIEP